MTTAGLTREEAWELLQRHLQSPNLIKHSLASEAILRALAPRFEADPDAWGIAGLLHDIDMDLVQDDMSIHGQRSADIVAEAGLHPELVEAIHRHNAEGLGLQRQTTLDHALAAAETITGLIIAAALVRPDKKLASVKVKSVAKKFKEPRFAAGANRETIRECEQIGLELREFIEISLEAMKQIDEALEL